MLAGEDKTAVLLQKEFPGLTLLPLKGYRVNYAASGWKLPLTMAAQIPDILAAIDDENQWLEDRIREYNINAVISDNRYGLFNEAIPSVFITHQLSIKTPFGNLGNRALERLNFEQIENFSSCWVPDHAGQENLAGDLSHPGRHLSIPIRYIGPLSRFNRKETATDQTVLLLLSGPEPQRTILEELMLDQLKTFVQPVVLVRGLPGMDDLPVVPAHVQVHNHLPAAELQELMASASLVISRCGYSTVMDLAAMQKKSILIPTPGQTEQEYLSRHLMEKSFALCIPQSKFRLRNAIELAGHFNYRLIAPASSRLLELAVKELVGKLRADG
jgi:hypothetical protein